MPSSPVRLARFASLVSSPRFAPAVLLALAVLVLGVAGGLSGACSPAGTTVEAAEAAPLERSPTYGDPFWSLWGDGHAELAGYDLVVDRYGEPREGTAVAIFVTESFDLEARVKSDRVDDDDVPVMKLNLIQDFPTGVYDYNLMTSAFVALEAAEGLPAGAPTKVSFSSQEWCGHVWHQALFGADGARHVSHSYFEGEADESGWLEADAGAASEDALMLWARGFAYPMVGPGETVEVLLLGSLERSRLLHRDLAWEEATLSRAADTEELAVPAGRFTVREARAVVSGASGERTWSFWIEEDAPGRLVAWERRDGDGSAGERGELLAAERLRYWAMNGPGGEEALERLGLSPRPPRTP